MPTPIPKRSRVYIPKVGYEHNACDKGRTMGYKLYAYGNDPEGYVYRMAGGKEQRVCKVRELREEDQ